MLIGCWPLWIGGLAQHYDWSPSRQSFVLAQRWRVAVWLIVLELVLVQGVLFRFLQEMMR
jgi:hypothetical protein